MSCTGVLQQTRLYRHVLVVDKGQNRFHLPDSFHGNGDVSASLLSASFGAQCQRPECLSSTWVASPIKRASSLRGEGASCRIGRASAFDPTAAPAQGPAPGGTFSVLRRG